MTATVVEDSVLGFWSTQALQKLLHEHPDYCRELVGILGERMAENQKIARALVAKEPQPLQRSHVV